VKRDRNQVKFWLEPLVELASNIGFARHEVSRIRRLVEENQALLLEAWHDHFDQA
jgi:hypothetical protein